MAQTWLEKYSTYEDEITGSLTGITAHAGGGQANATNLTAKYNNVTTVASSADSVKVPSALVGKRICIINTGANALSAYGQSGDYVNGTLNDFVTIGAGGNAAVFECIFDGYWTVLQ